MSKSLAEVFSEMDAVLGICPCCGEVFRLGDARPHLHKRKPASMFDTLEAKGRKLEAADSTPLSMWYSTG